IALDSMKSRASLESALERFRCVEMSHEMICASGATKSPRSNGPPPRVCAMHASLRHLTDQILLGNFSALVAREHATSAELLVYIDEIESRRLYAAADYRSMFAYCVKR